MMSKPNETDLRCPDDARQFREDEDGDARYRRASKLELQLVLGGALLNRQAAIAKEIERQGFAVAETLDYMLTAETPGAITQSAARCSCRALETCWAGCSRMS